MSSYPASKEHVIPAINGEYKVDCSMGFYGNHQLSIMGIGEDFGGTLTVTARSPGSKIFETVIDGIVDLSDIKTVLFTFAVSEYKFTLADLTGVGAGSQIRITDTPLEV